MSFSDLLFLYRARMAAKAVLIQEIFAILGIAVGVALLFSSQVASTSLTHSVERLTQAVVGDTQLQIDARGPRGFSEQLLAQTRRVPGVQAAFSVVEQQAVVRGPHGERSVEMLGVDPRAVHFGGPLLRRLSAKQLSAQHAVALPSAIAGAIGSGGLEDIDVQIRGHVSEALLGAVLGESDIGALANGQVLMAPVAYAQQLAGMQGRITRIFVRTKPGQTAAVSARLVALTAGVGANLQPATFDATLFSAASYTENQGETLFSAISALVGFMFALNAMLVTVPARRRLIEDIRPQGATRTMILQILIVDALVIGTLACVVGLAFGELLSISAFHATPGYLSSAFPVGDERIVTWQSVLLACIAGLGAACLGVLWPLRDILHRAPGEGGVATRPQPESRRSGRVAVGLVCLLLTTVVLLVHTQSWFVGTAALMVALVCLLPLLFDIAVLLFDRFQDRFLDGPATVLAVTELRNPRTRIRSLAVALTGAIAVFGTVAIGGAQVNLRHGLQASAGDIDSGAEIWISPRSKTSLLTTTPFQGIDTAAIARSPGVAAFGVYRGSFLDWGNRRLWILAPPANSRQAIPSSQLVDENVATAEDRIRAGGWVVLSQALAAEHHLHVGSRFLLPAPRPRPMRVAALTTNLGWPPGAIILNSADYAAAWGSGEPSGYEIQTEPGVSAAAVQRTLARMVSPQTGLAVETVSERQGRHFALIEQGLARFTELKLLVLIAGALAIAGAMGSTIWQRRDLISFMKVDGYRRGVLWRWLLCESAVMLLAGCFTGALFGLYGQLLISHALATVTGLPIALGAETLIALSSVLLVSAIVTAIVAMPGYLVVRVQASTVGPAY
jgi:putative ABC transport system permease protein